LHRDLADNSDKADFCHLNTMEISENLFQLREAISVMDSQWLPS
jgi:hypothetical protein